MNNHDKLRELVPIPKMHHIYAKAYDLFEFYKIWCPYKKQGYQTYSDYHDCKLCDKPLRPFERHLEDYFDLYYSAELKIE